MSWGFKAAGRRSGEIGERIFVLYADETVKNKTHDRVDKSLRDKKLALQPKSLRVHQQRRDSEDSGRIEGLSGGCGGWNWRRENYRYQKEHLILREFLFLPYQHRLLPVPLKQFFTWSMERMAGLVKASS